MTHDPLGPCHHTHYEGGPHCVHTAYQQGREDERDKDLDYIEWEAAATTLTYPLTEVAAVNFIAGLLRLPRGTVLSALGIAEKSFYNWSGKGNRARPSRTGTLWPMTIVLHALAAGHPNLAAWYHSSDAAQRAFESGDANALAIAESTWAVRRFPVPTRTVPDFDTPLDVPATAHRPTRARRTSSPARSTRPRKRISGDGG